VKRTLDAMEAADLVESDRRDEKARWAQVTARGLRLLELAHEAHERAPSTRVSRTEVLIDGVLEACARLDAGARLPAVAVPSWSTIFAREGKEREALWSTVVGRLTSWGLARRTASALVATEADNGAIQRLLRGYTEQEVMPPFLETLAKECESNSVALIIRSEIDDWDLFLVRLRRRGLKLEVRALRSKDFALDAEPALPAHYWLLNDSQPIAAVDAKTPGRAEIARNAARCFVAKVDPSVQGGVTAVPCSGPNGFPCGVGPASPSC